MCVVILFEPFDFQQICHRDLKLENTLLDGSPAPRLKICDFGYSKVIINLFEVGITESNIMYLMFCFICCQSSLLHSRPKSTVGTPAYIAPEVLSRREYDGKVSMLFDGWFYWCNFVTQVVVLFNFAYVCFLVTSVLIFICIVGVILFNLSGILYPLIFLATFCYITNLHSWKMMQ